MFIGTTGPGVVRRRVFGAAGILAGLVTVAGAGASHAQVAAAGAQNLNTAAGTGWPGGHLFLQRRNEPSLAVSSVAAAPRCRQPQLAPPFLSSWVVCDSSRSVLERSRNCPTARFVS